MFKFHPPLSCYETQGTLSNEFSYPEDTDSCSAK